MKQNCHNLEFRPAQNKDSAQISQLYEQARIFMRQHNNPTQWQGYPSEEIILQDIAQRQLYLIFSPLNRSVLAGAFVLQFGEEVNYREINGKWHYSLPYATLHRVASGGILPGIFEAIVDFSRKRCNEIMEQAYLRIDTHKDNLPMQAAIKRSNFQYCGIIKVADGSERLAYDLLFSPVS